MVTSSRIKVISAQSLVLHSMREGGKVGGGVCRAAAFVGQ